MALTQDDVIAALRQCVDPEIPVNIVDLGLVYSVDLSADAPSPAAGREVVVRMTLTSPGCPMSQSIAKDVQRRVRELPGVAKARVDIVWEPQWHPEMITAEGRKHLNLA